MFRALRLDVFHMRHKVTVTTFDMRGVPTDEIYVLNTKKHGLFESFHLRGGAGFDRFRAFRWHLFDRRRILCLP